MARRKPEAAPASDSPLPAGLRFENVTVSSFVGPEEGPEPGSTWDRPSWRKLRAWRRWQAQVQEWGAERGLDVRELRRLGLYPTQPPFANRIGSR